MNEANPVLENSHATVTPTHERPGAADHDAGEFQDATPHVYKTLPNRSIRGSFMDFFAPRRRQPDGQAAPFTRRSPRRGPIAFKSPKIPRCFKFRISNPRKLWKLLKSWEPRPSNPSK